MFQCPNCRAFTDLSAEVDDSNDLEEKREKESVASAPAAETTEPAEPQTSPAEPIQPEASLESQNIESTNHVDHPHDQLGDVTEEESLAGDIGEANLPNGTEQTSPPNHTGSASLPNGTEQGSQPDRTEEFHPSTDAGGLLMRNDGLGSFLEEDSLASGLEHLLIQDYLRTDTRSENTSPALGSSTTDLARSATISIPGWQPSQPLSIPSGRQAQLRSDTPGRSETSDDNPLTPRNDSGPLAFDGRAGMP
jgi:hypothetical protein